MLSHERQLAACAAEHHGNEQAQLAIPKKGYVMFRANRYLIENLTGSRYWFSEDSFLIGDQLRDHMQVLFGQGEEFPKRTIATQNAKDRAFWTVALQPLLTILASLAGCID